MEELKVLANSYADENVINVLKESIAKVYADGYRDGFKDGKEKALVDLGNDTEFVDLGLPSGTLWASDYEGEDNNICYKPYCEAEAGNIPTIEQWEELKKICIWEFKIDDSYDLCEAECVGPNGNVLKFCRTGKIDVSSRSNFWEVFFWLKDEESANTEKTAVHMYNAGKDSKWRNAKALTEGFFSGYKLPVRLVKMK
jgi:hypothetical protein